MAELPTIKVFKMDYDFLMKNYLNPEMWQKKWTLFQYKTFTITLNIYSIQTKEDKIRFEIKCYYHHLDSIRCDSYTERCIECSLKLEDLTFMKRQINSAIFETMVQMEKSYFIEELDEYEELQDKKSEERYQLRRIANEFLDEAGVSSEACREAYIDAYVDENERMYSLIEEWKQSQIYNHITDLYLTWLSTLEDDPKKEIRTKEIEKSIGTERYRDVCEEIKDFIILMEDTEKFEEEMKEALEDV